MKHRFVQPEIKIGPDGVLYYKLWHGITGGTSIFDYSLTGNDGVVSGSNIVNNFPGLLLNGSDDFVDVGATLQATLRGSFTIFIWVKLDDGQPPANEALFGERDNTGADSIMNVFIDTSGQINFVYTAEGNAGNTAITTATLNNGQEVWHNITVVADSSVGGIGGKLIYLDGVSESLGTDGSTAGVTFNDFTSAQNLAVGAFNLDGVVSAHLAGSMSDIIIFNAVKTAAEIKGFYDLTRWQYQI